jgi:hypothetical protein
MTTEQTLEQLVLDRKWFIENCMKIEGKDRETVDFKLQHIQQLELAEQSEWRRDLYVKPAQVGSTTLWAAVFLHDTMTHKSTTSVIVAHEEFITQRLLAKVQSLYDNLPESLRMPMHRSSAYEKTFPDINSTFYIGSSRAYVFGRGEPIHNFLGSEVAFWPDATRILNPTQDRVPMIGGTMILESTPNGEEGTGKYFHDSYVAAKTSQNIWKPHFYPWWYHEDYQIPEGSPYALPEDRDSPLNLTEEEFDLCQANDLNDDHIRWRRRKIREKAHELETGDSNLLFNQEFPENDVTCWIAIGDAAYDSATVEKLARQCYIPDKSYEGFMIWYDYEEGHDYVCSVDPGMGKESKTVIHIWEFGEDREEGQANPTEWAKHCATASGTWGSEIASAKIKSICDHYHLPLLAIETNPPGVPIAYMLQGYRRLYYRTDIVSGRRSRVIGWLTTPRTKPFMTSEMHRMLYHTITHDINLVGQFRNMRIIGDRVMSVGPDDHHDAAAIAMACRSSVVRSQDTGFAGVAGWSEEW